MKEVKIDRMNFVIYEDGSIRIPHKDIHLCLDFMDIALLFEESKKALDLRESVRKKIPDEM